jgi:hypothetical protein
MGITLGAGIVGKDAAARAERELMSASGGGAIQLGSEFIREPQPKPVVPAVVPVPKALEVASSNQVPGGRRSKGTGVAPKVATMTEDEVRTTLAEDPLLWPAVLKSEVMRPEGTVRVTVAALVLQAGTAAGDKEPLPAEVRQELEAIIAGVPVSV